MKILKKYGHFLIVIPYLIFYLLAFFYMENRPEIEIHIIHARIDDFIPFCEYFIIPYFLWFPYCLLYTSDAADEL